MPYSLWRTRSLATGSPQVAMLDRRMFMQRTHPARRLLNSLAEACEGNRGETPQERSLLDKVREVVDRLLAEFNENVAIFDTLEEEFRAFMLVERRNTIQWTRMVINFLADWSEDLGGKDLRKLSIPRDLLPALDRRRTSRRHRSRQP